MRRWSQSTPQKGLQRWRRAARLLIATSMWAVSRLNSQRESFVMHVSGMQSPMTPRGEVIILAVATSVLRKAVVSVASECKGTRR